MIRFLSHHRHTTRPPVQGVPDFQQDPFAILAPLMIPKPQHFNVPGGQKFFADFIALEAFGQPVLKAIQLHRQTSQGAIKVQNVNSSGMLPAEFETGEPSRPDGVPEGFSPFRLITAKLPRARNGFLN